MKTFIEIFEEVCIKNNLSGPVTNLKSNQFNHVVNPDDQPPEGNPENPPSNKPKVNPDQRPGHDKPETDPDSPTVKAQNE